MREYTFHTFHKILVWLVAAGTAAACLASCQKVEEDAAVPESAVFGSRYSFSLKEEDRTEIETKTVLTDASIETKQTGVTVGLYTGGTLVAKTHSSSFSGISFTLEDGKTYKLYALANMGDMQSELPSSESGLASLVYTIPAYTGLSTSVNTLGIPMAGSLEYTAGVSSDTSIPVKRLLAKVTVSLSCDWSGAKIKSAKVFNMNSKLLPFGTSAASGASDMLGFQEIESASGEGTNSLVATFYVPENMQGTVSGISSSENKSGDKNSTVNSNKTKLTYLEVNVESEGAYEGTVVYRSYLGNNATTNFDIQRNYSYVWTIHYRSSTVDDYQDDWKRDFDDMEVVDYSLSLSPETNTISTGEAFTYSTTLKKNIIKPAASSSSSTLPNSDATWSSSKASVATVDSEGKVTGLTSGTTTITARYTPGPDLSERTASATVTVQEVTNNLKVTGSSLEVDYAENIQLTAKYYTVTDGTPDAGTDVTSSSETTWTKVSGDASVTVGAHTGLVTASTYGTAVIRATYKGVSDEITVIFNRTDRTLELSYTPASPVAGENVQMSAKVKSITNGGTPVYEDVSAASVLWSIQSKSVADATVNIGSTGILTASKAVTAVVKGTYDSLTATASITFKAATDHYIRITADAIEKNVGETISLTAKYYTLTDGIPDDGVVVTPSWTRESGSAAISVNASGKVTATDGGSAVIRASYTKAGETFTDDVTVTFLDVFTHRLVLSADAASKPYNGTISLTATYYTSENGGAETSVAVTPTLSKTGGSNVTLTAGNPSTARLTDPSLAVVANNKASVTATYEGISSNAVAIEFTNVTTYEYTRLVVTGDSNVNVGAQTGNYTATLYTQTIVNGANSGTPSTSDVSSSATFASSATSYATITGRKATGKAAGTTYISASYTGTYGSITSASADRQALTVGNVEEDRYRIVIEPSSATIDWNATKQFTVRRYTDHYVNGALSVSGTTYTTMSASDFTWTSSSTSVASISASGVATGIAGGSSTIKATLKSSVANYDRYTVTEVSATLTVSNVTSYVYTRLVVSGDSSVNVGASTGNYTATLYTQKKVNGVDSGAATTTDVSASASFTSSATGVATITGRKATGVSAGTTYISASYTGTYGSITSASADRKALTVSDVYTHRLVLTADAASKAYSEVISLTATYYTSKNGGAETSVTVTPVLSKTGGSNVTLAAGNPSTARLTNPSLAVVANNKATVTATYEGVSSNDVEISFTNVTSSSLSISADNTSVEYNKMIRVTATLTTVTNGVSTSRTVTPTVFVKSGGANIKFAKGDPSSFKLDDEGITDESSNRATIQAIYLDYTSNSIDIEFTNVTTYEIGLRDSVNGTGIANVGTTIPIEAKLYAITNGVRNAGNLHPFKMVGFNWSVKSGDPGISIDWEPSSSYMGQATATSGGTAVIQLSGTYLGETISGEMTVTFNDLITYELRINANKTSAMYNESIEVTSVLYTLTNGQRSASVNVTPDAITKTGGSNVTYTAGNPTIVRLADTSISSDSANRAVISAKYGEYTSANTVVLSFTSSSETRYRLVMSESSVDMKVGNTKQLTVNRYADAYVNGVKTSTGTTPTVMAASNFNWTSTNTANASVSSAGVVTANHNGAATIKATLKSSVTDYTKYVTTEVKSDITVNTVYGLSIEPGSTSTTTGSTVNYKAYLVTDGVKASTPISSGVTWTSSDTTVATINSAGLASGVSIGSSTITARYTPAGGSQITATATLTVVSTGGGGISTGEDDGGDETLD